MAQEVFLQAWISLARYDPQRRFATWLYTIAVRSGVSQLRKVGSARPVEELSERLADSGLDPSEAASRQEQARALWALADEMLGRDQRTVLWLRHAEELEVKEIARVLGRSSVAVRLLLMRARRTLAEHLTRTRTDRATPRRGWNPGLVEAGVARPRTPGAKRHV